MKPLLLATAAVLAATVAQAETIYVTPGSAVHRPTKGPFKTAISGDENLLVVHAGTTNKDLIIVANQPDGTFAASANVLMLDDQGKLIENLHVIVTPCGGPDRSVQVIAAGKAKTYCASGTHTDASAAKDADSLTDGKSRTN